jgi:hypothetical protein
MVEIDLKNLSIKSIKTKSWFLFALLVLVQQNYLFSQTPPVWKDYVESNAKGTQSILPDYSYSGYFFSEKELPNISDYRYFNVTDFGAVANDTLYDDVAIQATIDSATALGIPAVIFFPAGKYLVSNDHDLDQGINIHGNHIVLKGEGSGENETEIYMDKLRVSNGHWQFRFHPKEYNTSTLTTISNEPKRGDFKISVASSSRLQVGQSIVIYHRSEEYARAHYGNLRLNETEWTRLFGNDGGMTVYECHVIERIDDNEVTFKNPIQQDLPKLTKSYTIRNLKTIEGIGIEDIRFTSGWGKFHREFVHHADDTVDYGWNAVQFKFVKNSWIKNCEFKDWTQVADIRESIGVTVDDVLISGKRGHASWITRRNYGVLIKDCVDEANHHHGPGVGYSGVSTVYLRYKMSKNQAIDCHSGSPITTLMDDMDGGDFHTNGGPWESYPHHGKYLTFWNFIHKKSVNAMYNFWSVDIRKPATYAEPYFIGFQPNYLVSMTGAGLDQMRGVEVKPKSLFEAQLALRLSTNFVEELNGSHLEKIQINPNPFTQFIQLVIERYVIIATIDMYGIDGKKVNIDYLSNLDGYKIIPQEMLDQGVYIIRVTTASGSAQTLKALKY